MSMDSLEIIALLERLSGHMSKHGKRILSASAKGRDAMDDSWHFAPGTAGRREVEKAADEIGVPAADLVVLLPLIWQVDRSR